MRSVLTVLPLFFQLMRTPLRRSAARNAESYARVHPDDEATATATTPATTTTPTTTTSTTVSSTRATAATTTTADTLTRTPAKIGAAPTLPALINSGREQAVTEKATLMIDNNNNSGMGTPEAMNSNTVAAVQHDSWLHTPITAKAQEGNTREGYDEMMLAGEGSVAEFTNSTSKGVAIHKRAFAICLSTKPLNLMALYFALKHCARASFNFYHGLLMYILNR